LNMAGEVIGVNTAILTRTQTSSGIGFAVPSNTVRRIVPYLIRDGGYEHTWLGISGMTLRPEQVQEMDLPSGQRGVMVATVSPNSPASAAGLVPAMPDQQMPVADVPRIETPVGTLPVGGDVITRINDQPVNEMTDLIAYLSEHTRPGDTVVLTVW